MDDNGRVFFDLSGICDPIEFGKKNVKRKPKQNSFRRGNHTL